MYIAFELFWYNLAKVADLVKVRRDLRHCYVLRLHRKRRLEVVGSSFANGKKEVANRYPIYTSADHVVS